ncbi:hypothetical protein RHECNPAF_770010 [Rhizobium etli CNPAF512]|nr:hypothetical protein RHECNPAF_770010 [Rhizobium etli CNPAF512]
MPLSCLPDRISKDWKSSIKELPFVIARSGSVIACGCRRFKHYRRQERR